MTTFRVYRDGTDDIETRIKTAVGLFYQAFARLPVGIVVHKNDLDNARAAVVVLGLALEVKGSGGALVPEVWLALPEGVDP